MSTDDDNVSLCCPITHELFRDPVKAEDGRLYEREAIIRWINQNGTSPFTRQTLSINQLQPDEHIKKKANQRRALSVTYNRASNQIELPPIRSARKKTHFVNRVVDIGHLPESPNRCSCFQNIQCPDRYYGTALVTNSCIASLTNIRRIQYDACSDFSYQDRGYGFTASSPNTTIVFAFQQTTGYWDIDNITLWNLNTFQNIFQNGDFESGSLSPDYSQCQSSGFINNNSQLNGRYCYSDDTSGHFGYLMQNVSTNIGTWYYLQFYLQNRNGPGSSYMVLVGD